LQDVLTEQEQLSWVELLTPLAVVAAEDDQHRRLEFRRMTLGLRGKLPRRFLTHSFDDLRERFTLPSFFVDKLHE